MNHAQFREVLKQRVVKAHTFGILGDLKDALIDESQKLLDLFDKLPDAAAELQSWMRQYAAYDTIPVNDLWNKLKELSDGK